MIKITHLKDIYNNITNDNIERLISYFRAIGGKELKVSSRRQNAFKTKWKEDECYLISRSHVQNAAIYIESIKESCSKDQVKQVISDILVYVRFLDKNVHTHFVSASTNTQPSTLHFTLASHLFYNHDIRNDCQSNNGVDLLVVYYLRLALESRVKRLLGVNSVKTKNGGNLGLDNLIGICRSLKNTTYSKDINWNEIVSVNKWLNHYIHRNIRPYPWSIYQAIKALEGFIDPKEPVFYNGRRTYSFYSATYIEDEDIFHDEVNDALTSKYPDIKIRWLRQREILNKK